MKKNNILIADNSRAVINTLLNGFHNENINTYGARTYKVFKNVLLKEKINYIILDFELIKDHIEEFKLYLENSKIKIFLLVNKLDDTLMVNEVIDTIYKDKSFFHRADEIIETINRLEKNKKESILVVDDSLVIREQLKDILEIRNYKVHTLPCTKEIFDVLKNNKISMIFLDVELKNDNGINFLQKHRNFLKNELNIPVIIISAYLNSIVMKDSLKAGAVDVIKKPFVKEEISLKVDSWVDYNRKQNEIKESTKLLKEYKEAVDESSIISKTDLKGKIIYVNDEFCNLTGYLKSELIGKPHNIVRHKDNPKRLFEQIWHTIKSLKKPWKGRIKNIKKNGMPYWVDAYIKPILDQHGNTIEYIGIQNDITEEENSKEYFKSKFEGSVKNLNNSILLLKQYENAIDESNILSRTDLKGIITYANERFCEVSGYKKEELIGKNHNIIRHPDTPKEIFAEMWATIKQRKIFHGTIKNKAKDGSIYWVNTTIVPILDEQNHIVEYMGIRNDITELFNLHEEMEDTQREVIYKMGEIGETRSKETGNHVKRVAEYSRILALEYGLSPKKAEVLFTASPMHDIGKVGIPDAILKKPGKLDDEEFEIMKDHAIIGYNILKGSKREVLKAASIVAKEHHEKWDGTGYPLGLKEDKIHIYGRITAVADVYDALKSQRCYKEAWEEDDVLELFNKERGKHFDPELIDILFNNLNKFEEIANRLKD